MACMLFRMKMLQSDVFDSIIQKTFIISALYNQTFWKKVLRHI